MPAELSFDPLIGSVLEGQYRVVSMLGRGGMGSVYIAEDLRLGRQHALKVLNRSLAEDRTNVERFLREARTIAKLQHANIIDVHSLGEDPSGIVFFTMELLYGEDLESRVKARSTRPYDVHEVCTWAIQIARAVAAVHDEGLIHRDLKTANIFLARQRDGTEMVKLLDFGIARPEEGSELTGTGVALGTPSYMSPEQLRSEMLDRRSDIYSFGVLFYKLLTGRMPFVGEPLQVAMQHWTAPPPIASDVCPEVPAVFDALILKAMAKARDERYSSMHEIERELVRWQSAAIPLSRPRTGSAATVLDDAMWREDTTPAVEPRPTPAVQELQTAIQVVPVEGTDPKGAVGESLITAVSNVITETSAVQVESPPIVAKGMTQWRQFAVGLVLIFAIGVILLIVKGMIAHGGNIPGDSKLAEVVQTSRREKNEPGEPPPPEQKVKVRPPTERTQPSTPELPEPDKTTGPSEAAPEARVPDALPSEKKIAKKKNPVIVREPDVDPEPDPTKPLPKIDPVPDIKNQAAVCRARHASAGGASIVITYAIRSNGTVSQAEPSEDSELGRCLADVVKNAQFEAVRRFVQKISL